MSHLKTSLYEEHVSLGARMLPFAGFDMPIQYENLKKEVEAVRNNVGVFDVSHMGEFLITGSDALKAIDHLVTNDIKNSEMKKAIYSPLCRANGTVIDDLIVYKISDTKIFVCVNASNIEKDFSWFEKNLKNFDVKLENHSSDYSLLAVQGPKTFETLKKTSLLKNLDDIEYYSVQVLNDDKIMTLAARTGYTGEDGFEIFASHSDIKILWKELLELGVEPCGLGSRDVLRLEVCYPLYGHELNDELTPLDSGLKWTVKLKKENFIGKEVLSSYKPKFKLVKLVLEKGIPRQDYPIENSNGEVVGKITSGTMSVVLSKGVALGLIKEECKDDTFNIDIRGKKYEAIVTKKPFVSGGHK